MKISKTRVWTAALIGATSLGLSPAKASADSWELRADEDGIRISTRPVPGSEIVAIRGETRIPATVEALLAVLMNAEGYPAWFPNCPTARELSRNGDVQIRYTVTSAPWPVNPRDAVFRFTVSRNAEAGSAKIAVGVDPDAHPRQDGHVRVLEAEGLWTLVPGGDTGTAVTWEMHMEPGGSLPDWLVNRRVIETPLGALRGLRAQVVR